MKLYSFGWDDNFIRRIRRAVYILCILWWTLYNKTKRIYLRRIFPFFCCCCPQLLYFFHFSVILHQPHSPFTSPSSSIYSRFANINLQREKKWNFNTQHHDSDAYTWWIVVCSIVRFALEARSSCSCEPNELGNECELNFIRHTQYVA